MTERYQLTIRENWSNTILLITYLPLMPVVNGIWTSIDDYSRLILYACLVERETTWEHILALEAVLLKYGFPLAYYVDSHSIFRFVQGRDSFWRNHYKLTDEANPQWKQVLDDCRVKGNLCTISAGQG